MPPLPAEGGRTLQAVGARRASPGTPPLGELVQRLRAAATGEGFVALFDAGAIAGERHLLSAWAHLGRSRGRGESRLRDRGAEFALWVAGDDQLPRALAKVGITAATERFVLVAERPRDAATLLATFGLVADPGAYPRPPDAAMLERMGIGPAEREAVPSSGWEGLVLERVALLDLTSAKTEGDGKSGHARDRKV